MTDFLYVANEADNTITVINCDTDTVVGTPTPVGAGPQYLAVTPDHTKLIVSNTAGAQVFSLPSMSLLRTISASTIGQQPVVATNTFAYFCNSTNGISWFDFATWTLGGTSSIAETFSIVISPDLTTLYVVTGTHSGFSHVYKYVIATATATILSNIPTRGTGGLAISPDGKLLYMGAAGDAFGDSGGFGTISTSSGMISNYLTLSSSADVVGVVIGPSGNTVWGADIANLEVWPFQTTTGPIGTGTPGLSHVSVSLQSIAVSSDETTVYVIDGQTSGHVYVLSTTAHSVIGTIPVGNTPRCCLVVSGNVVPPPAPPVIPVKVTMVGGSGLAPNGPLNPPLLFLPNIAQQYVLSGYFRPYPAASPSLQEWVAQLDWYAPNGSPLSSSVGAPVLEVSNGWVRPYVVASPPAGARTMGRTFSTVGSVSNGERHLFDAEQIEINRLATPGPSTWHPPQDIKVNLLPLRQNLVQNPVGLGGTFGWITTGATNTPVGQVIAWPAEVSSGFKLTTTGLGISMVSSPMPVNQGEPYTAFVYAYTTGALSQILKLTFYDGNNNFIWSTQTKVQMPSLTGFLQVPLINVLAPANAVTAVLENDFTVPVAGQVYYVTAFMFEPTSALRPYFDANFSPTYPSGAPSEDYIFEGSPNESISDYYPALTSKLSRLGVVLADYTPIGSTYSLVTGAAAFSNISENG